MLIVLLGSGHSLVLHTTLALLRAMDYGESRNRRLRDLTQWDQGILISVGTSGSHVAVALYVVELVPT